MLLLQLSCLLSLGLCIQASNRAFSARNRQGKNSRLLSWGAPSRGAAPISLYRSTHERARSGGGRRQPKYAALLQNIFATNKAEVARENDKLLERKLEKGRRGKEGEDLLIPPYNSDFDQGQIRLVDGGSSQMGLGAGTRQAEEEDAGSANAADSGEEEGDGGEEEVRCIKKVMQVEEVVWDTKVRCEHRFTRKCHSTYITDYTPTQERKCETSFKKNCHITYKPVMYSESVSVCSEPLERVCSNTTVGEEICRTHYETTCETRFKEHEVEQDEPVCKMVTERKCRDVQVPVSAAEERRRRQSGEEELLSLGQECEDWPVQKCTLEKKTVKKVNPDTSCRKIPREICAPSNCEFLPAKKVCHDEEQDLVQNIPTEDCNLEPQEDCRMETVLVPRLVLKPNCIKIPKEICSEAKVNPRKVSKPVIREWCYKPSDLRHPGSRLALSRIFQG